MRPVLFLMMILTCGAAEAAQPQATVTAEEAVLRQQEQVRKAINLCAAATEADEIVVCGKRADEDRYALPSPRRGRNFEAGGGASLFSFKLGAATIGCCSIKTGAGTGAGLSLKIPF